MEVFNQTWREPHMVQAFLPDVAKGDKRIVLVDGEVAGAINRLPGAGEIRSNLAVGGSAEKTELTDREREICAALGPELSFLGMPLNARGLNSWFGSAFVMLTGLGLFEVCRRQFAVEWGVIQEAIEKEIKRRETS